MNVTVTGAKDVSAALEKLEGAVRDRVAQAVADEADQIAADERAAVPVRTGRLRAGIQVRSRGELEAEVGIFNPKLIYAIWIEWGRSSAAAQPFATPAAELARHRWPARAADAVKEGVRHG